MSYNIVTPGERKFFQHFDLGMWKLQRNHLVSLKKLGVLPLDFFFFFLWREITTNTVTSCSFPRSVEFAAIKEYRREACWDHNYLAVSCYRYIKLYNILLAAFDVSVFSKFLKTGFEKFSIWRQLQILYENVDPRLLNCGLFALLILHRPLTCT